MTRLARIVAKTGTNDDDAARQNALAALIAARGLDADTELIALRDPDEQVRRLATAVLGGAGAGLDDDQRLDAIQEQLSDRNGQVRYEAVRALRATDARHAGAAPLLDLVADRDTTRRARGHRRAGRSSARRTRRSRRVWPPKRATPAGSAWHRETHAFVALAKRAPGPRVDRDGGLRDASVVVGADVCGPRRGGGGRCARLEKLAYDANDNVREAALVRCAG